MYTISTASYISDLAGYILEVGVLTLNSVVRKFRTTAGKTKPTLYHCLLVSEKFPAEAPIGKFSHCGIDVFTFLRMPQGWKIVSLAYSIEPDACGELQGK
jgi:hypothetical protein